MPIEADNLRETPSPFDAESVKTLQGLNPGWQHSMLRVRDPKASVEFYKEHFGCTLVNEMHFEEAKFSLYFLATLPKDLQDKAPTPGTPEAHKFLWDSCKGLAFIELTHNHGTEDKPESELEQRDHADRPQLYHNGNTDPVGFGHIAFNVKDVYATSEELEKNGVPFKKRPDEGRMKGIAFALDPDGYWIELVPSNRKGPEADRHNFSQTMMRIKDPVKSIAFYRDLFGMEVVRESHYPKEKGDFSLFFLATPTKALQDLKDQKVEAITKELWDPCLELTWNHGTEDEEGPSYHNGNDTEYKGKTVPQGFGHVGFLVDNLETFCQELEKAGCEFKKKPQDGSMRNIAFVKDPTGYWVEVIQRDLPTTTFQSKH
ncbi:Lactoylglutathione lyase [Hondaea fermentalgiana]|uniref:lactoylglutathione lyase n=1 Tax=Hondaea fermentalgiana TaxID=2315210 RepID=A0A2R5GH72_9STRA|nr:Lactoylglutathione lyase [Hondaea fermentalgiana]|eukprot:GBG30242.1 Lactoylglutathione lyase [Hondaea fermentalgiana]